jgi:hypothetical protein
MRKDKSALFVSGRFGKGTCTLHALAKGKGSKSKGLVVYVCARNADGEKASGNVCADHAAELLAVSNVEASVF